MTHIAKEIGLFAQNLIIDFQLDTQIGNVFVYDCLVGSKASETEGKQYKPMHMAMYWRDLWDQGSYLLKNSCAAWL